MRNLMLFMLQLALWPVQRYFERYFVLRLDLGGDAPPPPDYTPVANASKEAAEIAANLAREQLGEARYQYDQNMAVARPVAQAQLDIMRQTADQGADYYEYGKSFRPLEQQMLRQAQGQLTPAQIVRLGVSGLQMPSTLGGKTQSAGVIAGAGQSQSAQSPQAAPQPQQSPQAAPQQQPPGAPILRFAQSARQPAPGARFQGNAGVLPFLSSSDMNNMLNQQGGDTQYAGPAAPKGQPITLGPVAPRPAVPAPTPTGPSTQTLDAFKTDMLKAIEEQVKKSQQQAGGGSGWANDGT